MGRVRNTNDKQPKLLIKTTASSEAEAVKAARSLGATEVIMGPSPSPDGRNYFQIVFVKNNDRKEVYELDEDSTKEHVLLGTADGESFGHCFLLGGKNVHYFWERVCGYRITIPTVPGTKFALTFYEKK